MPKGIAEGIKDEKAKDRHKNWQQFFNRAKGAIDEQKMQDHVRAIAKLKEAGHEIILISSGAVAAGFGSLGYPSRPVTLKGKQAAAAVGQGLLMQKYTELFHSFI